MTMSLMLDSVIFWSSLDPSGLGFSSKTHSVPIETPFGVRSGAAQ